jgi:hypothetical protein
VTAAVLAARDPEWFESVDKLTPADLVALAEEFTKQQVAKVQHGEQQLGLLGSQGLAGHCP